MSLTHNKKILVQLSTGVLLLFTDYKSCMSWRCLHNKSRADLGLLDGHYSWFQVKETSVHYEAIPIIGRTLRSLWLSCRFSLFFQINCLNLDEMTARSLLSSILLLFKGGSYVRKFLCFLCCNPV